MVTTHLLIKRVFLILPTLILQILAFSQNTDDSFRVAVRHHHIKIDQTLYPVTCYITETGEYWINKGIVQPDSTHLLLFSPRDNFIRTVSYHADTSYADTIHVFAGLKDVNPDNQKLIFSAEVFYAMIGDLFLKETGQRLFSENTLLVAHAHLDFQRNPTEYELSFLNLPITDGPNTLYYCHVASSNINGLQLLRYDSNSVSRKRLRPVETALKGLRQSNEILHCAEFRMPDLLFVDGMRYYFVPECLAYGEYRPGPKEKQKFGNVQSAMLHLNATTKFHKKPRFFQWVKSFFQ